MQMAIEIARSHHEHWDGSGYPSGISGEKIPLSAQIVSIVNTYCALTEKRTYRKAYTMEEASEVMRRDAGTKYNAYIYEIFTKISRQMI